MGFVRLPCASETAAATASDDEVASGGEVEPSVALGTREEAGGRTFGAARRLKGP
jgi:hypothetical protein